MSPNPNAAAQRRLLLQGSATLASAAALAPLLALSACGTAPAASKPVASAAPAPGIPPLTLPAGHTVAALAAWGEPVGLASGMPAWKPDASNTAAEQALQVGMNPAGLQYLPLDGSRRGLLVMAHQGADEGLLHQRGMLGWSAEKVAKSQAAHGLSVLEIEFKSEAWQAVRPSRHARRITAQTPLAIGGPAAGHAWLKTAADPSGRQVRGTLARSGVQLTPWGTVLVGEAGFNACFCVADQPTQHERRYGLRHTSGSMAYRWHEHDERFDAVRHPNEANRHGWIVEFDPTDPTGMPVKRTALGRGAHAGLAASTTADGRAVVYAGDGSGQEYLYRYVSGDRVRAASGGRSAALVNAGLLDEGTLYVARLEADGSGRWLPLVQGLGPLKAAAGFASQAEVLIKARQAADALGATRLGGTRALALDGSGGWICAALAQPALGSGAAPAQAQGQLLRWKDQPDDRCTWELLLSGGEDQTPAGPAALARDGHGSLWVGTAAPGLAFDKGQAARNQLLSCNLARGHAQRFLSAPVNADVGGVALTPDGRTLFVNFIQRGGAAGDGRPRPATLAIRRKDAGVVGV